MRWKKGQGNSISEAKLESKSIYVSDIIQVLHNKSILYESLGAYIHFSFVYNAATQKSLNT